MEKTCKVSGQTFEITEEDQKFYEKIGVPAPTLCSEERARRRMAFRNERNLYHRTCSATGKKIIAQYSSDKPFPVYENDYWWSDKWDARDYALDFDFNRPFFEQFDELQKKVPHYALAVVQSTMENSDFCNNTTSLKDCYLMFNTHTSERCLYGNGNERSYECVDCLKTYDTEACYECLHVNNCHFCTYLLHSQNCDECHFSSDLIGCSSCFGCTNLRNKKYYFMNEKCTKQTWEKKVAQMYAQYSRTELFEHFYQFRLQHPCKWMIERNTENCTGNYLYNCKNCEECWECEYLENSKFCNDLKKIGDVNFGNYDVSYYGANASECYEGSSLGNNVNRVFFSESTWFSHDIYYSRQCVQNNHDLFGCVGMRNASYCILNKQYTKEEYEVLVPKIIEHMGGPRKTEGFVGRGGDDRGNEISCKARDGIAKSSTTREYGEFFPVELSPIAYNESIANWYYPLSKEEVLARGWSWKDPETSAKYQGPTYNIPDSIEAVEDDVLEAILTCEESGKNYRITKLELQFYRKMGLPLPRFSPEVRYAKRMAKQNPRHLFERACISCGETIRTAFDSNRPEKVFCEVCYLKSVE